MKHPILFIAGSGPGKNLHAGWSAQLIVKKIAAGAMQKLGE
jgi:hypothetical protein